MESAESFAQSRVHVSRTPGAVPPQGALRDAVLVLQVDGAVAGIHGLAWLAALRDRATQRQVEDLHLRAMTGGWEADDLLRAQLALLRPRRAEINALGQAYLAALVPGAVDAVRRMARAGVPVELSGEVGIEAMYGVADALGVDAEGIHAPRLRFDALGSFVSADVAARHPAVAMRRAWIGTHASEVLATGPEDVFVRFTGVVAHEGPERVETVGSFGELAELVLG